LTFFLLPGEFGDYRYYDFFPGSVGNKPSETRDKPHFQRHSCPGPDFWAENGKKGILSQNFPLICHLCHYPLQINFSIVTSYLAVMSTSNGEAELILIDLIQKLSEHMYHRTFKTFCFSTLI